MYRQAFTLNPAVSNPTTLVYYHRGSDNKFGLFCVGTIVWPFCSDNTGAVSVLITGCPLTFTAGVQGFWVLVPLSVAEAGSSGLSGSQLVYQLVFVKWINCLEPVSRTGCWVIWFSWYFRNCRCWYLCLVIATSQSYHLEAVEGPVAARSIVGCRETIILS